MKLACCGIWILAAVGIPVAAYAHNWQLVVAWLALCAAEVAVWFQQDTIDRLRAERKALLYLRGWR